MAKIGCHRSPPVSAHLQLNTIHRLRANPVTTSNVFCVPSTFSRTFNGSFNGITDRREMVEHVRTSEPDLCVILERDDQSLWGQSEEK